MAAIWQDFRLAVRPVFFQTAWEEFLYATHGGTLFLVEFEGSVYALTCFHVFRDFELEQLFVARAKHPKRGSKAARVAGLARPSAPFDGASGTDIVDLCAIWFSDDTPPTFFDGVFQLSPETAGTSASGHRLLVEGVLKEKTRMRQPDLGVGYCTLELQDTGPYADPFLRTAEAEFSSPQFSEVTGISGAPVYDLTTNKLCGMTVRGGMIGNRCQIYYFDVADILRFLSAIKAGESAVHYSKPSPTRWRPERH